MKTKEPMQPTRRDDGSITWAVEQACCEMIEDYLDEAQEWTWEAYCRDEKIVWQANEKHGYTEALAEQWAYVDFVKRRLGLPEVIWNRISAGVNGVQWWILFPNVKAHMAKWTRRYNIVSESESEE